MSTSKEKELQVKDVMTPNPVCCTPETSLREVARLMVEHDCGEIPVVDSEKTMNPVGVITDRDITCRTVALGRNPLEMIAGECMSSPSVIVMPDTSLEECCKTMEISRVRRVPVVNEISGCCGIVSQADIAANADKEDIAEVVRQISQPRYRHRTLVNFRSERVAPFNCVGEGTSSQIQRAASYAPQA